MGRSSGVADESHLAALGGPGWAPISTTSPRPHAGPGLFLPVRFWVMKSIIVGTAGHIDHGKTALVKALTGIDADRLEEEKRRGITIDLGFANMDLQMAGDRAEKHPLPFAKPNSQRPA